MVSKIKFINLIIKKYSWYKIVGNTEIIKVIETNQVFIQPAVHVAVFCVKDTKIACNPDVLTYI